LIIFVKLVLIVETSKIYIFKKTNQTNSLKLCSGGA